MRAFLRALAREARSSMRNKTLKAVAHVQPPLQLLLLLAPVEALDNQHQANHKQQQQHLHALFGLIAEGKSERSRQSKITTRQEAANATTTLTKMDRNSRATTCRNGRIRPGCCGTFKPTTPTCRNSETRSCISNKAI